MWVDEHINMDLLLTESLQDPEIQFLDLYVRKSFLVAFSSQEIKLFMEKIGALPNLERLDISCPYKHDESISLLQAGHQAEASLPVSALQSALSHKLTHLLLVNLKLSGSPDEFQALADKTSSLSRLHCVVFAEVRLKNNHCVTSGTSYSFNQCSMLDPIVRSFRALPSLCHVLISGCHTLGTLQPSTLQALANSSSVRDLCLSQLSLHTEHLRVLSPILCGTDATATNLRELDLQCHLTVDGAHILARILQRNKTLEKLSLRLEASPSQYNSSNNKASDASPPKVSSVKRLITTKCGTSDWQDDHHSSSDHLRNTILAEAVPNSNYLTTFELENADLSTPEFQEPFLDLLRYNYFLDTVRLYCLQTEVYCLEQEIAFFTRLNEMGRGHLFQCPHCSRCDEAYLTMLECLNKEGIGDDRSFVFYFLSRNPSLICISGSGNDCGMAASRTAATEVGRSSRKQLQGNLGKRKRLYRAVKYNRTSYS